MTPHDTRMARIMALGPRPPWWRPVKRHRWKLAAAVLLREMVSEIAHEAAREYWEALNRAAQAAVVKARTDGMEVN